jgi:hypothetical protein
LKVIVVPPQENTEKFVISSIVQMNSYLVIAIFKWIFIYDAVTFQALSYWQAHETQILSVVCVQDRIWSVAKGSQEIMAWDVKFEDQKLMVKVMPLGRGWNTGHELLLARAIASDLFWCQYADGSVVLCTAAAQVVDKFRLNSSSAACTMLLPLSPTNVIYCTSNFLSVFRSRNQ